MRPQLVEFNLSAGVYAFSTTRKGGVGVGNYSELNITDYCGDDVEHVIENRNLLCQKLGINDSLLFLPHQVHGTKILKIDDDFLKEGKLEQKKLMSGIDAVMTSIPGICIGVSTADCVPILLYDEVKRVSAAVHAGWRGTLNKIVSAVLKRMMSDYGSDPSMIKVLIGPSISLSAFEVGVEVYDAFLSAGFPMNSISRFYNTEEGDIEVNKIRGKWHIDLWAANCLLLEESGIDLSNIKVANICTVKSADSFFSARKLGVKSGRIFTGIMIK